MAGVAMLALYIVSDSFTSQWQSRLYQAHPTVDQFQMMFAVNTWAIIMTTFALVTSGELWITLQFIGDNPIAFLDNVHDSHNKRHRPALHLLHDQDLRAHRVYHNNDDAADVLHRAVDGHLRPRDQAAHGAWCYYSVRDDLQPHQAASRQAQAGCAGGGGRQAETNVIATVMQRLCGDGVLGGAACQPRRRGERSGELHR